MSSPASWASRSSRTSSCAPSRRSRARRRRSRLLGTQTRPATWLRWLFIFNYPPLVKLLLFGSCPPGFVEKNWYFGPIRGAPDRRQRQTLFLLYFYRKCFVFSWGRPSPPSPWRVSPDGQKVQLFQQIPLDGSPYFCFFLSFTFLL